MQIFSPFAGIVHFHVSDGQSVEAGQTLATVEAVKLEATVPAPGPGKVVLSDVADFDNVVGGQRLLELVEMDA